MKGVVALQAHMDGSMVNAAALHVATIIGTSAEEVQAHLTSNDRAVLGSVFRLLHLRGKGVIWSPADDYCVAGRLIAGAASTDSWRLGGRVSEVVPADTRCSS